MSETYATVPAVWVLIFDRCPMDNQSEKAAESRTFDDWPLASVPEDIAAFDRLDLHSTCFEQFLLQNICSNAKAFDVFGGESALYQLTTALTANEQTANLVRLTGGHAVLEEDAEFAAMETSLRRCQLPLGCVLKWNCFSGSEVTSDRIEQVYSASLVWMEARTVLSADSVVEYDQILNFVFEQLQHQATQRKRCPVLIVTFRSGNEHFVLQPLSCGIAENRIHVPLWIRPNAGHACRVQALAGSFDLVPTILTFLGIAGASDEDRPPDGLLKDRSADSVSRDPALQVESVSASRNERTFSDANTRQATEMNSGEFKSAAQDESSSVQSSDETAMIHTSSKDAVEMTPPSGTRSLAFLCGAPQVCPDRLLVLRGDGWKAARTEEFQLVLKDLQESRCAKTESDGDNSAEPSRRLYVKPEDFFNVNDVSGTYATAADSLARMIE